MGMVNVSAATTLAIEYFQPKYIINQGTAGGHSPDLHVGDIVIGTKSVNIGAIKTPFMEKNKGSDSLVWSMFSGVMNLRKADGSEEINTSFKGNQFLIDSMLKVAPTYEKGKVKTGVIGSSDVWNREVDRILWFHKTYETIIEEMESSAVGQIAKAFNIPFVGVRVVSNSDVVGETYTPEVAINCQEYVYEGVKTIIG